MRDIHLAGVLHGDAYARKMMVAAPRNPGERMFWITVDTARVLPDNMPPLQWKGVDDKMMKAQQFGEALVSDLPRPTYSIQFLLILTHGKRSCGGEDEQDIQVPLLKFGNASAVGVLIQDRLLIVQFAS